MSATYPGRAVKAGRFPVVRAARPGYVLSGASPARPQPLHPVIAAEIGAFAMPHWNHVVDLADLWAAHDRPFEERRDAIVVRIRQSRFYSDSDIVLRNLLLDIANSTSVEHFDREFSYLYAWGDQDHVRVWFETHLPPNTEAELTGRAHSTP